MVAVGPSRHERPCQTVLAVSVQATYAAANASPTTARGPLPNIDFLDAETLRFTPPASAAGRIGMTCAPGRDGPFAETGLALLALAKQLGLERASAPARNVDPDLARLAQKPLARVGVEVIVGRHGCAVRRDRGPRGGPSRHAATLDNTGGERLDHADGAEHVVKPVDRRDDLVETSLLMTGRLNIAIACHPSGQTTRPRDEAQLLGQVRSTTSTEAAPHPRAKNSSRTARARRSANRQTTPQAFRARSNSPRQHDRRLTHASACQAKPSFRNARMCAA